MKFPYSLVFAIHTALLSCKSGTAEKMQIVGAPDKCYDIGHLIYQSNCASCHLKVDHKMATAPAFKSYIDGFKGDNFEGYLKTTLADSFHDRIQIKLPDSSIASLSCYLRKSLSEEGLK